MAENEPITKADLAAAIQELKEYIDERTHDAETRLLRAFVDYSASSDVRVRKLEADTHTSIQQRPRGSANWNAA